MMGAMKIIVHILGLGIIVGALLGFIPLACFSPEHGRELVKIQLEGACLMLGCLFGMFLLGVIASWLDHRRNKRDH